MRTNAGALPVEVLRAGVVAVIESASETAHYPQLNRGVFTGLNVPWLSVEFFDESELDALLADPLEERFAAVVFTPGAVALPGVRACLARRAESLARALAHGVGLVITATSLGGLDRFDLSFLPEGGQVSLVDMGMREMSGTVLSDGFPDREVSAADGKRARSGLTLASSHAFGWTHAMTLRRDDDSVETVSWRAQFGRGRIIVSVLPFEWLGWREVVDRALTRATRSRGCLIVGDAVAPTWYDDVEPGQFLARLPRPADDDPAVPSLFESFSHLRLCSDMSWPALGCLTRSALLARLENDGSVEFAADGPGDPIYARLHGVPRYLVRLRQAQAQLVDQVADLPASPTFHVLALALLSEVCEQVVRGRLFVPDLLRRDTVRSVVEAAVARRVRDGSVDGLLLPTVNMLVAGSITGVEAALLDSMTAWVKAHAAQATPDQRAQARWSARAADRLDLVRLIPVPNRPPESMLGQLSCQLDAGQLHPLPTDPPSDQGPDDSAAGLSTVPLSGLSGLDAAILAYSHARWSDAADPDAIWDVLEGARRRSGRGVASVGNVEELCYRTAAAALLDAEAPLTVHPTVVAASESIPRGASALLAQQAAADVEARRGQQATEELNAVIGTARVMAGILAAVLFMSAIVVVSVPLWMDRFGGLGLDVRLTLAAAAFVIASTLITLALRTTTVERVSPRWVRALGDLVRALRPG